MSEIKKWWGTVILFLALCAMSLCFVRAMIQDQKAAEAYDDCVKKLDRLKSGECAE